MTRTVKGARISVRIPVEMSEAIDRSGIEKSEFIRQAIDLRLKVLCEA